MSDPNQEYTPPTYTPSPRPSEILEPDAVLRQTIELYKSLSKSQAKILDSLFTKIKLDAMLESSYLEMPSQSFEHASFSGVIQLCDSFRDDLAVVLAAKDIDDDITKSIGLSQAGKIILKGTREHEESRAE